MNKNIIKKILRYFVLISLIVIVYGIEMYLLCMLFSDMWLGCLIGLIPMTLITYDLTREIVRTYG